MRGPRRPATKTKTTRRRSTARTRRHCVNLALQGGGAHGAFTWGVLDRLLEDASLEIEGVSATSAGALNAAVMAHGLRVGGRSGARAALKAFWRRVSEVGTFNPLQETPFDAMARAWGVEGMSSVMSNVFSRIFSPYQLNPLDWNPLRIILNEQIDFDALRTHCDTKLFISTTNVRSGKNRIFQHHELSADVLLASACIPFLFQAVEIDGEAYWDGGYMGNPAIYPLIYHCASPDVMIVQINPIARDDVPQTASEILDRVNEISFNATLMREMRAIAFVSKLIDQGRLDNKAYKRLNLHLIQDELAMSDHSAASKLSPDPAFVTKLHDTGWSAADRWLADHLKDVGKRSSIDITEQFL